METSEHLYTITILRDEEYMEFILPMSDELTVLDALDEIRYTMDDSLQYRHSCHHGSCGTCACIINGTERLACMTRLSEFSDHRIKVKPLASFQIITDLVVDLSSMVQQMPISSYLRDSEINTDRETPSEISRWVRFENCIECGSCISACPVSQTFLGPAPLAAIHREILKRDDEKEVSELKALAYGVRGVSGCEKHFVCSKVCPVKVSPGKHITELRREMDS